MTRYLLTLYQPDGNPSPDESTSTGSAASCGALNEEMRAAGAWVFAGGLHAAETATVVRHPTATSAAHRRSVRRGQGARRRLHGSWRPTTSTPRCAGRQARSRATGCRSRCGRSRTTGLVRARPDVERVFREEYGRAVAVLVRVFGDIDVAEEAVQDAFAEARAQLAGDRRAAEPRRLDHHDRAPPRDRPAPPRGRARGPARAGRAAAGARATPAEEGAVRGRPAAADLHLLPSGARARRAGRADAAAAGRAHDRGDRPRVPGAGADDGAAARAREGQDPRRAASRTACPTRPSCPAGCAPCSPWSTSMFNEGYTASAGDGAGRARTCAPRRSGSAGCSRS